jgi:formiminotetrahydrofolate cyclodeaminase
MSSLKTDVRLTELRVNGFLALLANNQPVPGGGSAAALAGAMAAALTCMAARLSIGRERYEACQDQMRRALDRAEVLGSRLTMLVDEDALAYRAVINACSLPRADEMQATLRTTDIQRALRYAVEVPAEAADACAQVVELAASCATLGNRNAASDAAVAALLANAGLRGAAVSARTNLSSIRDEEFRTATEERLSRALAVGEAALLGALAAAGLGE